MRSHAVSVALWIKTNEKVFRILGVFFFVLTAAVGVLWIVGRDVESVAFVLGCVSSSMFGAIEVAKYFVPDRKSIREMGIDELLSFIQNSNAETDWKTISTEVASEAVHKEDPRLRATMYHDDRGVQTDDFKESWANSFPDTHAQGHWVEITYDRALIDRRILVSVDGARAMLPLPKSRTDLTMNPLSYRLAQLFDSSSTLDEYARRAGLKNAA